MEYVAVKQWFKICSFLCKNFYNIMHWEYNWDNKIKWYICIHIYIMPKSLNRYNSDLKITFNITLRINLIIMLIKY